MGESSRQNMKLECMICGVAVKSVYLYHKHNIQQHSLPQLSRAILKLKNLQVPLNDPPLDGDQEEEEEDKREKEIELDMAAALDHPVKLELLDEEVIELGPTANSDNLEVQSRLVKNAHQSKQQSRQVIEVKENQPPPCHINPSVEDPDAIVVKFNRELVMALDNSSHTIYSQDLSSKRKYNSQLRAAYKSKIEIPDPNTFIMDYRKALSKSTDKYVMQNVSMVDTPLKKRRGRPKKNKDNNYDTSSRIEEKVTVEIEYAEEEDEEAIEALADPPLFSEDEDEEAAAAIPNVTKTRSGRTIKIKKEDGTFKYYDMPGRDQLDTEDPSNQKDWTEASAVPVTKGKRGRKRKSLGEIIDKRDIITSGMETNRTRSGEKKDFSGMLTVKEENIDTCDIMDVVEEGLSMPTTDQIVESSDVNESASYETEDGFECFECCKKFSTKEECERHAQKHINKEEGKRNTSKKRRHKICNADGNASGSSLKMDDNSTNEMSAVADDTDKEKNFHCSVCNEDFPSRTELEDHTHETVHECKFCGKQYQNRVNLQTHIKRYHEETEWMKFKCATCGKNFGFLTALERHMKEHNPNQKFCCEQCGKVFKSLVNLKNHIPLHTKDEVYECPYCPKQYYIRYSYEKHVKSHVYAPKFHCEICDKNFNDKKSFELHLERHQHGGILGRSKDLKCNNCGDIKSPTDLQLVGESDPGHHKTCLVCGKGLYKKYMIENNDVSQYLSKDERVREQCKLCGKWVLNLPRHIKYTHLENEYVTCDICNMIVTKASLPAHKNRKHGGSAVTCDHCNRIFKNIMCLREHMAKVRRKEDPLKNICKYCKEIVSPENWKDHMMKHRTKCSDCGAAHFTSQEEFMNHLNSCRKCSNCSTTFTSREEFLSHIEMCSSGINIITGNLDSASDQEVVTSIFAIVDESTGCETCGEMFEDQGTLAQHIAEAHPNSLDGNDIISEAILYACPQESCGVIVTNKELLKEHLASVHNAQMINIDSFT
ncbi:zinc finger and BTB domain-containing protein 17-like [Penaeus indicus]|uniref:zinc finger and BTB domain-containing protein 17-like n=1 Tax=Penaeus indicus TaxID=29960 RepID=UPI00300D18D2